MYPAVISYGVFILYNYVDEFFVFALQFVFFTHGGLIALYFKSHVQVIRNTKTQRKIVVPQIWDFLS